MPDSKLTPNDSHPIVEIRELSRRFGKTLALDKVSLTIHPRQVYGLVGANGQGKTTLIKHILGLLKAQSGSVHVFGQDPVARPVQVLQRIGYLSEERDLPAWMRVDEMLRYTGAFHPSWDADYARELLTTFGLDPKRKIKNLSKGMKAQAGLIAAVAHRPELLLLDEPSTGLDALVRKDILNAIVRTVADAGRTVLFSSHLLDEVEQMSDYILMIDSGRLVLHGQLDTLKEQHHRFVVRLPSATSTLTKLPGLLATEQHGDTWHLILHAPTDSSLPSHSTTLLQAAGAEILSARGATLQEIFVARVGLGRDTQTTDPSDPPPKPQTATSNSVPRWWRSAS